MKDFFSINSPFWELADKTVRLLWLSLLWMICSLPVFTIGASTTALYTVTLKYVRDEEGYLTSSFLHAFRKNFRQSTVIEGISLAAGIFLLADFAVYYRSSSLNAVSLTLFTVFLGIFVVFLFANIYVYPLLAYFDNTIRNTLFNALMMAVCHLPASIAMLTFSVSILTAGLVFFPPLLFAAPGITAWFHSRLLRNIFDQYQATPETA